MKIKAGPIRILFCSVVFTALAGCTTYIQQPALRAVYVPPPPVIIEPPRVSVAPPPVSVPLPPPAVYVPAPPPPAPELPVTMEIRAEEDFYEPLRPYGRWEVVGAYGRCWIPSQVGAEWRPYCNGHWERTDAGWYWGSEEPWGWATYHYGRWDFSAQVGWYWVPQTVWAPAWVSWHRGGGYMGWAPLHPSVRIGAGGPVEVDVRAIPARAFVFVEEKRFLEPVRPATVVVHNTTIINQTVNITNIRIVNKAVVNEGPRTQIIEQASGRQVKPMTVRELRGRDEAAVAVRRAVPVLRPGQDRPSQGQPEPRIVRVEQSTRVLEKKAQEDSQRHAKELERQAQLQSEQRTSELQKQAQEESQRHARDLAKKAQFEAEQHSRELHAKAQEESERHAKELEKKAQLEAQEHAKELEQKAREESQKHARELERQARLKSEQHSREVEKKAQDESERQARAVAAKAQKESQRRVTPKQPGVRPGGTNAVTNGNR